MAFQDAWAKPLAETLVKRFRVDGLEYVRVNDPIYDPATGTASGSETRFQKAGAVYPPVSNQAEGGAGNVEQIQVELYLEDVGNLVPTTRDYLEYLGKRWKVVNVATNSGDLLYSATITARAN
tara:strand:- start:75 stop:443 length:369 start_codon:yes stop_codon:yes gene_type:complete